MIQYDFKIIYNNNCSIEDNIILFQILVIINSLIFPQGTLDVQNVTVNVIPGSICVSCILVHNSPARGCVLIASQVGVDSNIESKINIPSNESGECLELSPGRYRARVVDWEADGGLSGMYAHQEVVDIIAATSGECESMYNY